MEQTVTEAVAAPAAPAVIIKKPAAEVKTVFVGCKLPNGIILEHPKNDAKKVELNGLNKNLVIGAEHAVTEVEALFWDAWIKVNSAFDAVKSGAIFVASDARSLESVATENKKRKTGLEPMSKDGKDPRAAGAVTEDGK